MDSRTSGTDAEYELLDAGLDGWSETSKSEEVNGGPRVFAISTPQCVSDSEDLDADNWQMEEGEEAEQQQNAREHELEERKKNKEMRTRVLEEEVCRLRRQVKLLGHTVVPVLLGIVAFLMYLLLNPPLLQATHIEGSRHAPHSIPMHSMTTRASLVPIYFSESQIRERGVGGHQKSIYPNSMGLRRVAGIHYAKTSVKVATMRSLLVQKAHRAKAAATLSLSRTEDLVKRIRRHVRKAHRSTTRTRLLSMRRKQRASQAVSSVSSHVLHQPTVLMNGSSTSTRKAKDFSLCLFGKMVAAKGIRFPSWLKNCRRFNLRFHRRFAPLNVSSLIVRKQPRLFPALNGSVPLVKKFSLCHIGKMMQAKKGVRIPRLLSHCHYLGDRTISMRSMMPSARASKDSPMFRDVMLSALHMNATPWKDRFPLKDAGKEWNSLLVDVNASMSPAMKGCLGRPGPRLWPKGAATRWFNSSTTIAPCSAVNSSSMPLLGMKELGQKLSRVPTALPRRLLLPLTIPKGASQFTGKPPWKRVSLLAPRLPRRMLHPLAKLPLPPQYLKDLRTKSTSVEAPSQWRSMDTFVQQQGILIKWNGEVPQPANALHFSEFSHDSDQPHFVEYLGYLNYADYLAFAEFARLVKVSDPDSSLDDPDLEELPNFEDFPEL